MKKTIVTLRSAPAVSVEVPEHFPRARGEKGEPKRLERSGFGALRLFPGVPRTVSCDELEFIRRHQPEVAARLDSRPYVESKRVDYRGATESEIEAAAAEAGISHLPLAAQCDRLQKTGKIKRPDPKKASATVLSGKKGSSSEKPGGNGNGGKTSRKPR
jgi:hypothetical protein